MNFFQLALEEEIKNNDGETDILVEDVTDVVENQDNSEQIEQISNDIEADVGKIEDEQVLADEVNDKVDQLSDLIEQPEEEITDTDIAVAHESLVYTMMKCGYSKEDVRLLRPSSESYNNKKMYLILSRESVWEAFKSLCKNIWELLVKIGRQFKVILTKIVNVLDLKARRLTKLISLCEENKDKKLEPLSSDDTKYVVNYFYTFLKANNFVLNTAQVLTFISENDRNPFIHNIKELYEVAISNNNLDQARKLADLLSNSRDVKGQDAVLKLLQGEGDFKNNRRILYIYSIKGHLLKMYIRLRNGEEDNDLIGIDTMNYEYKFDGKSRPVFIDNVKTYGDCISHMKKIRQTLADRNNYINSLNIYNSKATDLVKKAMSSNVFKEENISEKGNRDRAKHAIKIIQDIGGKLMFEQMSSYNYNISRLVKVYNSICAPLVKSDKDFKKEIK